MAPQAKLRDNVDGNKMDLSMSGITEVPVKDIAAIKKATILDLSNNQLTSLPPSFTTLTHLVELDLSKNMIRELPESFGNLSSLRRLDLYGNQLTHLPLSFCHLKALRWLDLKNNPLVPTLAGIAGPCGDMQQCQQCARNIVATLTQTAIKVEEDRTRLLEEKLREQEQIEQELLMKKKQLDAEENKKSKKKSKKGKAEKQGKDASDTAETSASKNNLTEKNVPKASGKEKSKGSNDLKHTASPSRGLLKMTFHAILLFCAAVVLAFVSSVCIAVQDRKLFVQITSEYQFIPENVTSYILQCAKHVEYAAKHPTVKEMRSQLAACFRSIIASILNIYKTVCQEFPVYYDVVKSKFV